MNENGDFSDDNMSLTVKYNMTSPFGVITGNNSTEVFSSRYHYHYLEIKGIKL